MATPLVKLETKPISLLGVPYPNTGYSFYRSQDGYKGVKSERSSPLAYYMKESRVHSAQRLLNGAWTYYSAGSEPYSDLVKDQGYQRLINKAWSKLWEKIHGEAANLGETLGEIRESGHMVANRFEAAYEIARKDYRRFRQLSRALRRSRFKVFADWWLEYQFGWKPLVQDVTQSLRVMSQDISPPRSYKAGASRQLEFRQNLGGNPLREGSAVQIVGMGCKAYMANPNRALLNRLGLANPVLTAFNLTPWSFVADWLFDVSTYLGSFTDSFGFDVSKTYTSTIQRGVQSQNYAYSTDGPSVANSVVFERLTSLSTPFPNLAVMANVGDSLTRATNAIALLVQILARPT